jgi:hypothetical protein
MIPLLVGVVAATIVLFLVALLEATKHILRASFITGDANDSVAPTLLPGPATRGVPASESDRVQRSSWGTQDRRRSLPQAAPGLQPGGQRNPPPPFPVN